jgi:uncharacterized protein
MPVGWRKNAVYCHLKRKHEEVYFHANGSETDFVVKEGMRVTQLIRVWYVDVTETAIPDWVLACFNGTLDGHEGVENILVTNDYEDLIKTGTATIQCIPAVKFLLFISAIT